MQAPHSPSIGALHTIRPAVVTQPEEMAIRDGWHLSGAGRDGWHL